MTTPELRAFAHAEREMILDAMNFIGIERPGQRQRLELLDAFLAEHRADDDELITPEWLKAVGFWYNVDEYGCCDWLNLKHLSWTPIINVWYYGGEEVREQKTRGQLRRLCSALGIELKEPT